MPYEFTDANQMIGKRPRQVYFTELQQAVNELALRSSTGINVIEKKSASDPITTYPTGVTVYKVDPDSGPGFPSINGSVETVYLDEVRNIQHFFTEAQNLNDAGKIYYRQWMNNSTVATWTKWRQLLTREDIIDGLQPTTFEYAQLAPLQTWTISHGLGRYPTVTVVDTTGTVVIGDLQYNSNMVVTINFTIPFNGTAYLN